MSKIGVNVTKEQLEHGVEVTDKINTKVAVGTGSTATGTQSTAVGYYSKSTNNYSTAVGRSAKASGISSSALGNDTEASGVGAIALGYGAKASKNRAIQIGEGTNDTANTFKVGNVTMLNANGKIPASIIEGGGGGGGTTDYDDLSNKPSINNVTLSGNKSLSDLGIPNIAGQNITISDNTISAGIEVVAI